MPIVFIFNNIDSPVNLPYRTFYSELVRIANLEESIPSNHWWWMFFGNVYEKKKILHDQEAYCTLLKDLEIYTTKIILEKLSLFEAYDSS